MLKLIVESRHNFHEKNVHLKLLRRFWRCLNAYQNGQTYGEVLRLFFSKLCTGTSTSHARISNSNLI